MHCSIPFGDRDDKIGILQEQRGMMWRIGFGSTKIWSFLMLFPSTETNGTFFDRIFTDEEVFSGKGNCSLCITETVSRSPGLHASRSQVSSSAA
jgi:hypothetical protein